MVDYGKTIVNNSKVVNELSSDVIKRDIETFKKFLKRIDDSIKFAKDISTPKDYMKAYSAKYEDIITPRRSFVQPHWEDPDSIKRFREKLLKDLNDFKHSKELLLKELEGDLKRKVGNENFKTFKGTMLARDIESFRKFMKGFNEALSNVEKINDKRTFYIFINKYYKFVDSLLKKVQTPNWDNKNSIIDFKKKLKVILTDSKKKKDEIIKEAIDEFEEIEGYRI